jgi:hypothetical protein
VEIEVPGALLGAVDAGSGADWELRRKVAEAVSRAQRFKNGREEHPRGKLALALRQAWLKLSGRAPP